MRIPWRKIGSRLVEWALTIVRATAPDKGQADPREPSADEAFDKWRDGVK